MTTQQMQMQWVGVRRMDAGLTRDGFAAAALGWVRECMRRQSERAHLAGLDERLL